MMGTANEWMWVVLYAIFWGGGMLLWEWYWSDTHIKPALSFVYVSGLALASLWFGLVVTFHWRAFHWPLILLSVACIVGALVLGRSARRKVRSGE